MKTKTYLLFLSMLCVCICAPLTVKGQVKIGGSSTPAQGAVLDLNADASGSYSGGLLLPNVFIEDVEFIPASFTDADKMIGFSSATGVDTNAELSGTVVYNTNDGLADGAGVYVWNGYSWQIVSGGGSPVPGNFMGEKILSVGIEGGKVSGGGKDLNWGDKPGSYKISLIDDAGGATLTRTDPATGEFEVTFAKNETGVDRQAVVRVTSPSHATQDYVVSQTGLIVIVPGTRGTGRVTGRYCYDIAVANDNGTCGLLSSRLPRKANFSVPQIYTFTGSGSVTNVRATTEEIGGAKGKIFAGTPSVSESAGKWTISIDMKEALYKDAVGLTTRNALKGRLIVVYHDGERDVFASCEIQIRDCACCGAIMNEDGLYRDFMCHNLGANLNETPWIPSPKIHGDKFRFGDSVATYRQSQEHRDTHPGGSYQNDSLFVQKFKNQVWKDPCPEGFKIPSIQEFSDAIKYNHVMDVGPMTQNDWFSGIMIGDDLFMPAASCLNRGPARIILYSRGSAALYAVMPDDQKLLDRPDVTTSVVNLREGYPNRWFWWAVSEQMDNIGVGSLAVRCITEN